MNKVSVIWFRRGLRLHDNPALRVALSGSKNLIAVYIYDTTFSCTIRKSYHQSGFLLESLADLDDSLRSVGGKLHIFKGCPLAIFRYIHDTFGIERLCFQRDFEPIWQPRDDAVKELCADLNIKCFEGESHTLWDPNEITGANGGTPPLTYEMFLHVAMSLGDPQRPLDDVDWTGTSFSELAPLDSNDFKLFAKLPTLDEIGIAENPVMHQKRRLIGGEKRALEHMALRLQAEASAFRCGRYQPNQARPDLLGPPLSLSAALSLGCLSVRRFYWEIHDLYDRINQGKPPAMSHITGQLIWREYFYTMALRNPHYDKSVDNPICLKIPWDEDESLLDKWKQGRTGYPFIDAAQRQLLQEGWMHHTARNAVAMFLTRGDLWINWERGAEHFMEQLVDCDWAVNSGNWMWVTSTAFERMLNCSICINPVLYGKRLEPSGDYIRKYVPELANFTFEYIHEPWKAPLAVQEAANCIIGRDYPERIVVHEEVSRRNQQWMMHFRKKLMELVKTPPSHCQPSSESEVYQFFGIDVKCFHGYCGVCQIDDTIF